MSYSAIVYNVMIASPSDVSEERDVVRKVINNWNKLHSSKDNGIVLLAVDWENHSAPRQGKRGQEIINEQVLEKADLLIGIFWNRVGTPTGEFESGTVEEIERHIKANRPTMLYFSDKPSPYDPNSQRAEVEKLKAKYRNTGLTWSFNSTKDFEEKLKDHLITTINDKNLFPPFKEINPLTVIIDSGQMDKGNYLSYYNPKSSSAPNSLSPNAKALLENIYKSRDGFLDIEESDGITTYRITDKLELAISDDKEKLKWKNNITELEEKKYIKSTNKDHNHYKITPKGNDFIESLE